jgi:hypothetical protein
MYVFVGASLFAFVSGFQVFNYLPIFIKNGKNFVLLEATSCSLFNFQLLMIVACCTRILLRWNIQER